MRALFRSYCDICTLTWVPHGNADEVLAHLARDVREDFVAIGQFDPKHGAGQHLRDGSRQFDVLFFWHGEKENSTPEIMPARLKKSTFSSQTGKNTVDIHA